MKYSKEELKIVFMGTPDFAVASLDALVKDGYNVVGVITAPDKPAGRGKKLNQSAVKKYAQEAGLNILQPTNLKDQEFQNELQALGAHVQVVVAFRMLPKAVWNMPALGTFNLHASLLPQYRGAAPINWAVINGDAESGVSTFLLNEEIDTGAILFQEKTPISEDDNAGTLHDRLMDIGTGLVVKTVDRLAAGDYEAVAQDEDEILRPAPKLFKENTQIDWSKDAVSVRNLIRGLSPYPAAWTSLELENGKKQQFKLFATTLTDEDSSQAAAGTWQLEKKRLLVATADRWLQIDELQPQGKKRMDVKSFINGFQGKGEHKFD